MFDEKRDLWNNIWKKINIISTIGYLLIPVLCLDDFIDLDYVLFRADIEFVLFPVFIIVAIVNYCANMLILQLLANVKQIAENTKIN